MPQAVAIKQFRLWIEFKHFNVSEYEISKGIFPFVRASSYHSIEIDIDTPARKGALLISISSGYVNILPPDLYRYYF